MRNVYVLILITLAGSAQAITWADYYAAHQAQVNAAVARFPHHLNLRNKGLTDLNGFDTIPGLDTLQNLYLENNLLRELPPTIFQSLTELHFLHLSNNQLVTLPSTIFQGANTLQVLHLYNNQLRELPPTVFQGLNTLQELHIYNNQLRELPPTIFQTLNALQELYLNNNKFRELPPTIFHDLNALQVLFLSVNQLEGLPPTIFHGLNALQELSLFNDQLKELPPTIFQGLTALRRLHLDSNQFRALPPTIFRGLNALRIIYLENNRIPGTTAKLRATLQLPNSVDLLFKTSDQEHVEALFSAIDQSNVAMIRQLIGDLVSGRIRNPRGATISIPTLRDLDGNNLLHAAIISAARHVASIAGRSLNVQGSEEEKNAQRAKLAKDKSIINASYMKVIDAILDCGERCAQAMLATPNAEGENVINAAIEKLGLYNSPITEALLKLGLPAVDVKAKLESSGSAATQRLLK